MFSTPDIEWNPSLQQSDHAKTTHQVLTLLKNCNFYKLCEGGGGGGWSGPCSMFCLQCRTGWPRAIRIGLINLGWLFLITCLDIFAGPVRAF